MVVGAKRGSEQQDPFFTRPMAWSSASTCARGSDKADYRACFCPWAGLGNKWEASLTFVWVGFGARNLEGGDDGPVGLDGEN